MKNLFLALVLMIGVTALADLPNGSPRWSSDPIDLGEIKAGTCWVMDLLNFVVDPGEAPLQYTLQNQPAWLYLDEGGLLRGCPRTPGNYQNLLLTLNDGTNSLSSRAVLLVVP